jgi:hypothetical protein
MVISDLNSYHTANLAFVTQEVNQDSKPDSTLPALRRHLYRLKDTLNNLQATIKDSNTRSEEAPDIVAVLSCSESDLLAINRDLSIYLSNHGSDWLNSLLSGGLSFSEFRSLDITYIVGVEESMAEWAREIRLELALHCGPPSYGTATNPSGYCTVSSGFMDMLPYRLDTLTELRMLLKVK